MRRLMFAAIVAFSVPTFAMAADPAPGEQAKLPRNHPDRVVCRNEEVTGSLAQTKKVCMKNSDWAARSRNAQDAGNDMQQRGSVNSCGATAPGAC
jgi:hypothetical protein